VVQVLQADEDVANCVQPHPSLPILATSGIEPVIRCAACVICSCRRFIFSNMHAHACSSNLLLISWPQSLIPTATFFYTQPALIHMC